MKDDANTGGNTRDDYEIIVDHYFGSDFHKDDDANQDKPPEARCEHGSQVPEWKAEITRNCSRARRHSPEGSSRRFSKGRSFCDQRHGLFRIMGAPARIVLMSKEIVLFVVTRPTYYH